MRKWMNECISTGSKYLFPATPLKCRVWLDPYVIIQMVAPWPLISDPRGFSSYRTTWEECQWTQAPCHISYFNSFLAWLCSPFHPSLPLSLIPLFPTHGLLPKPSSSGDQSHCICTFSPYQPPQHIHTFALRCSYQHKSWVSAPLHISSRLPRQPKA